MVRLFVVAIRRLAKTEAGVAGLEYALLASLIGVVVIGSVMAVGLQVDDKFTTLTQSLNPKDDPKSLTRRLPVRIAAKVESKDSMDSPEPPEDTGARLEIETGSWDMAVGTRRPVTISAVALLAAVQGSGLDAAPAAGPNDGPGKSGNPASAGSVIS